jgi:predicted metal-dependent phosphoesterase TrpH
MASARAAGLDVVALTDHDTISGWQEARQATDGLEFVPGAEISCQTEDEISLHMLGLLFDPDDAALRQAMEITRDDRLPRMEQMVAKLAADGIAITMEKVWAEVPDGATLGRPHLADALVRAGVVTKRDEAFIDLLHNDSKYYVGHLAPTPADAIRLIKSAGGVAIFAHPGASKRGDIVSDEMIASLVPAGLDALEVDHRDHDTQTREHLRELAAGLGLLCTGASDYHGTGKQNLIGEHTTDPQVWEQLKSRGRTWNP